MEPQSVRHADDQPHARDKAIDGWRAIAASFVVLAHAINYRFGAIDTPGAGLARRLSAPLAEIGVQLFFVISGYIITSLLLREQGQRNSVSIAAFYARRVCRIMPPLFVYYAAVLALAYAGAIALAPASLAASATFTCNTGIVDCQWWVAHTWSLAVEEQFYIGWPLLFALVPGWTRPLLLAAVTTACMIGAIVQKPVFHGNFTSFACIAVGALYATAPALRRFCLRAGSHLVWIAAVVLLVIGPLTPATALVNGVLPLLVVYVIFVGNKLAWVQTLLKSRPLQFVGAGSYSLYLWQQLFFAKPELYATSPLPVVLLPLVVVASVLLVERPFIKLGRRLSRRVERPVPAA